LKGIQSIIIPEPDQPPQPNEESSQKRFAGSPSADEEDVSYVSQEAPLPLLQIEEEKKSEHEPSVNYSNFDFDEYVDELNPQIISVKHPRFTDSEILLISSYSVSRNNSRPMRHLHEERKGDEDYTEIKVIN